jgi:hypothetical protein
MLVEALRRRLGDPQARSFQLMGEDLALLTGGDLAEAAQAWQAALDAIPLLVRPRLVEVLTELQAQAHAFLRKYNRNVHARVAGYVEMARRCRFAYPWPVVAILGIEQVLSGLRQNRLYGLVGEAARWLGFRALSQLSDGSDDILRRTNRGIFADSVPTMMLALRARSLRQAGETALAEALVEGPLPPFFDDECRALARALTAGLELPDPGARFEALAELTLRHFGREQAIFSFQIGPAPTRQPPALIRRLLAVRDLPAPVVEDGQVVIRPFVLSPGFDLRDHDARVAELGRAFVTSVTTRVEDYRHACTHVLARWGRPGEQLVIDYCDS